jgi:hypothetical protein
VRKGGAPESARNRLFAGLHSHFMAEWKPARARQIGSGGGAPGKRDLPFHCAVQHMIACFKAKFFVTIRLGLV